MTRYLISFDDGAMTFPEEELPDVAEAAHTVVQEAKDAGVWVFGGGLQSRGGERRGHRRDGHRWPVPGDQGGTSAGSRSSTCPHARRRWSGLPRSPSPAGVPKRSGSSCPVRPLDAGRPAGLHQRPTRQDRPFGALDDRPVPLNHATAAWLSGSRCPQRDSNPRYSLERAVTWAASRWGPGSRVLAGPTRSALCCGTPATSS